MRKLITKISEIKQRYQNNQLRKKIQVASLEETIAKIKDEHCSISRFGDGEFYLMEGKNIGFQKANPALSERLKQVFASNIDGHLVCIGNGVNQKNYGEFTKKQIDWLKSNFRITTEVRLKYIHIDNKYYNALISRFWIPFKDKSRAKKVAEQLKRVWAGRNVVIIEGQKTRMGVGNDLLDGVASCRRILGPATDAFDRYDEILAAAKTYPKDTLFLIALGPTATILAYDLFLAGYQALDIGHIDLEYEWMRLGVLEQVNLPDRYINELQGGEQVRGCDDTVYLSQVEYQIL